MESLEIPKRVLKAIERHAIEERPNEACGIITGIDFRSCRVRRMTNADPSPVSYFMEPVEQFRLFKELREAGEQMLSIYHSHPVSEAYPSSKDIELAFYPDVIYLIISLRHSPPVIKGFTISEGTVTEKQIIAL